jgi:hypothetical protein
MIIGIEQLEGSCPRYLVPGFADAAPVSRFEARPRSVAYDRGRVAYFRKLYATGWEYVEPLDVVEHPDGSLVLTDGHHRLAGAIWAGCKQVTVRVA